MVEGHDGDDGEATGHEYIEVTMNYFAGSLAGTGTGAGSASAGATVAWLVDSFGRRYQKTHLRVR